MNIAFAEEKIKSCVSLIYTLYCMHTILFIAFYKYRRNILSSRINAYYGGTRYTIR